MKFVTAIKDYKHKITDMKVISNGTWYVVCKESKDQYYIYNDYGRKMWVDRDLFINGIKNKNN